MLSPADVVARIDGAVAERRPFSLIRLGDGEGALLAFDEAISTREDYRYLRAHLSAQIVLRDIVSFQKRLRDAIQSADVVGVRDDVRNADPVRATRLNVEDDDFLEQFKQAFPLRDCEREGISRHSAFRLFQLWSWIQRSTTLADKEICSAWTHFDLQLERYWEGLIARQSRIGLIHNSRRVGERIHNRLGAQVDLILVPLREIEKTNCLEAAAEEDPTQTWARINEELPMDLCGQIYLVAAGLAVKGVCQVIKARNGIAIDIGSVADGWNSKASRHLVIQSKMPLSASPFGAPCALQLLAPFVSMPKATSKELLFHTGFSKTGTTSIQETLRNSGSAIEGIGLRYLHSGRDGGTDLNHHQLARAFGSGERPYDAPANPPQPELIAELLEQLSVEMRDVNCTSAIISSELFTNFGIAGDVEDVFIRWLRSHHTRIIVYVRNQFDWLLSWYAQAAKNGNMSQWLDEFVEHGSLMYEHFDTNYLRKLEYFEAIVGKERFVVRSYDEAVRAMGLVHDFFHQLGAADVLSKIREARTNESPAGRILGAAVVRKRLGLGSADVASDLDPSLIERAMLIGRFENRREQLRSHVRQRTAATNAEIEWRYGVRLKI